MRSGWGAERRGEGGAGFAGCALSVCYMSLSKFASATAISLAGATPAPPPWRSSRLAAGAWLALRTACASHALRQAPRLPPFAAPSPSSPASRGRRVEAV